MAAGTEVKKTVWKFSLKSKTEAGEKKGEKVIKILFNFVTCFVGFSLKKTYSDIPKVFSYQLVSLKDFLH